MNIGDASSTVDLAPGANSGVLYDGMAADGSSVLYTTVDQLTADDHDSSADIYRADVGNSSATLDRVSNFSGASGETGDTDPVRDRLRALEPNRSPAQTTATRWQSAAPVASTRPATARSPSSLPELLDGPTHGVLKARRICIC